MKIIYNESAANKYLQRNYAIDKSIQNSVTKILSKVKAKGDSALFEYTKQFDKTDLSKQALQVTKEEIKSAYKLLSQTDISAIKTALNNIKKFQKSVFCMEWTRQDVNGVTLGQLVRPLERVGVYVPAGRYPLPSSALMGITPAKVAGVKEIVVCIPPKPSGVDPYCIVAADLAGADKIFKVGGAQAIAAMAFGTKTIPKVDKIVGPGNVYVTEAKRQVFGVCGIDMLAGPSEVMVIAKSGNPKFIAADLLAQAEHDVNSKAILLATSKRLAKEVSAEVKKQLVELTNPETAREAIKKNSAIIVVNSLDKAFELANKFAPEHLELIDLGKSSLKKLVNAGAVFFGEYSCETLGDYCSGTNHILPTGGYAKVRGGLSVLDFVKTPSIQIVSKRGLLSLSKTAERLAEIEGLEAHKRAVEIRRKKQ